MRISGNTTSTADTLNKSNEKKGTLRNISLFKDKNIYFGGVTDGNLEDEVGSLFEIEEDLYDEDDGNEEFMKSIVKDYAGIKYLYKNNSTYK